MTLMRVIEFQLRDVEGNINQWRGDLICGLNNF